MSSFFDRSVSFFHKSRVDLKWLYKWLAFCKEIDWRPLMQAETTSLVDFMTLSFKR